LSEARGYKLRPQDYESSALTKPFDGDEFKTVRTTSPVYWINFNILLKAYY